MCGHGARARTRKSRVQASHFGSTFPPILSVTRANPVLLTCASGFFTTHINEDCWGELVRAMHCATSAAELKAAHVRYLEAATRHCLQDEAGLPSANAVCAVFGLILSLHRELSQHSDWDRLVEASRRQFEMLTSAMGKGLVPLAVNAINAIR